MTDTALKSILRQFSGKQVLVIGDVILDEYIWGEVNRISPEAPVPVVEISHRTYLPGGAANTAANVAGLGGRAILGGVVGEDLQADCLRRALSAHRVQAEGMLADPSRPTTTKTRIVAHNQQMVRVDFEKTHVLPPAAAEALRQWADTVIPQADSLILSDYEKGVLSPATAQYLIRQARQAGKPVVVDPKGKDFAKYRGATVIKPNLHEAEIVFNHKITGDEDLIQVGRRLLTVVDGSTLLITRGPKGMSLFRSESDIVHIPAYARNVFDVTGAGDTVVGVMALALASGASTHEAARLANHAAGIVVGKVGTATVSVEEIEKSLEQM